MIGPLLLLALAQEIPGTRTPFDLSDPAALLVELEAVELSRLEVGGGSSLGFDEVVRSVDRHHPELLGARQRQGGAAGQLLAAEGGFDLRLDAALEHRPFGYYDSTHLIAKLEQPTPIWGAKLYAGYELGLGKIPLYDGDYETLNGGELKAGLRVPIWRDGPIDKRRAAIGKATFILDAEAAATRVALLELSLDAGEAYWKWVAAGQSYLVAVALYDLARDRDAQLASKVQRGAVPAIDRAENLRAVLTRREAVVTARRSFEQAALKLSLYARDDDGARGSRTPNACLWRGSRRPPCRRANWIKAWPGPKAAPSWPVIEPCKRRRRSNWTSPKTEWHPRSIWTSRRPKTWAPAMTPTRSPPWVQPNSRRG